jgi:hypothetical protein
MATPNYAFAKRQRDLAKKQKKEEKQKRKGDTDAPAVETTENAQKPPEGTPQP